MLLTSSWFRFKSIKRRFVTILGTFVVLVIILLGLVHYLSAKQALLEDIRKKQLITYLKASQSSLQSLLLKAIETSELLAEDPALLAWFEGGEKDGQARELGLQKLDRLQKNYNYTTVFAINDRTKHYWRQGYDKLDVISCDDPYDSWYFNVLESKIKTTIDFDYNKEIDLFLVFVDVIMGDVNKPLGIAGVGLDPSVLINEFRDNKISDGSTLWLIDEKGRVEMAENVEAIDQHLDILLPLDLVQQILKDGEGKVISDQMVDDQKVEVAYLPLGNTRYKVVMMVPDNELVDLLDVIRLNSIWLSVLILTITLIIVSLLASQLTVPIIRLTQLTGLFANGDLKVQTDRSLIQRKDEIGQLARAFESMKNQLALVIDRVRETNDALKVEKEHLKRINYKLETALVKASESDRLTKAFLANISHEIRTPMNSIMGFAQILELGDLEETDQRHYAGLVVAKGQQLIDIINGIVNISKIESEVLTPHYKVVHLNKLFDEIINLFSQEAHQSGLKLDVQKQALVRSDIIETDEAMLKQVLNNLVSNAIKFTHEGSIVLSYNWQGEKVEFVVKDTGIGIPGERLDTIFEPFVQLEDKHHIQKGGAGLGLTLAKQLVKALGGELRVKSTYGQGTTFYFSIALRKSIVSVSG